MLVFTQLLPSIYPEDSSLEVIDGKAIRPASVSRLFMDGAASESTHRGSLYPRHARVPIRPEQDSVKSSFVGHSQDSS